MNKRRIDLALVIIGSEAARKIADEIANDRDVRALVIARLDAPGKILVDPRCARRRESSTQRFGTRAEAADFIAMLATAEAFKLIAGYAENPSRATIEFDGYETTSSRSSVMYKLWMFDFDNTIARLEPEVDWAGGRLILEPYLRSVGAPDELFARIPRGNLPLYDAYRTLTLARLRPAESNRNAPARFRHNREARAGGSRSRATARRRNRNTRGSEERAAPRSRS